MDFTAAHDQYLAAWDAAFRTGTTTELERFPAPSYQGYYGHAGVILVEPVDREEAIAGVRLFSRAAKNASHRAENRVIRMRSGTESVVTYERIIEKDGAPLAVFAVMQSWRKTGQWRVVRESVEHIG